jgi:hypothetical protein
MAKPAGNSQGDTLVWDEVESFGALQRIFQCVYVWHHPWLGDRPLFIGHASHAPGGRESPPALRLLFRPLRLAGARCYVGRVTPAQFEHVARIERFLVRSWRPFCNRRPAANARVASLLTYKPWGDG